MPQEKRCPKGYRYAYRSRMSLSEVMTIAIAFNSSGFRTFKEFYTYLPNKPFIDLEPKESLALPICGQALCAVF
jgi:hypothetical protein